MCWDKYWRELFSFQGYVISDINLNGEMAVIRLDRDGRRKLVCPACGKTARCTRRDRQMARDLSFGIVRMIQIHYEAIQIFCNACRCYSTLHPEGIDSHARATERYKLFVSHLCRHMPLNRVPEFVPISAATAFRWDKEVLQRTLPKPNLTGLEVLLVDEKAVRKHYGYVTLVMNAQNGELLHMAEGKKKESLQSFFDQLTPEQRQSIKAVAMDRNGAYHRVVRTAIPHARIVFDKFHVIANFHKVIDKVRNQEYAKACKEDKDVIKGQRFNLYRNPENRPASQAKKLNALLAINANLCTVFVLKDSLKELWTYRYSAWAKRYLDQWVDWAKQAAIPALTRFAEGLLRDQEELIAYCQYPVTIGRLEGFNNTVSRLIHRACGVRDMEYFYLKLRQESLA